MKIAALAFGLFVAAFLLHWIIWRIKIPRRPTAVLLAILLGTLPVALTAVIMVPALQSFGLLGFWEVFHVSTFHVAMSILYVWCYLLLEQRSPSMTLLTYVADAKGQGRTREELLFVLRNISPVERRLDAMVLDNLVAEANGTYRITNQGRVWVRACGYWRALLGMEIGG